MKQLLPRRLLMRPKPRLHKRLLMMPRQRLLPLFNKCPWWELSLVWLLKALMENLITQWLKIKCSWTSSNLYTNKWLCTSKCSSSTKQCWPNKWQCNSKWCLSKTEELVQLQPLRSHRCPRCPKCQWQCQDSCHLLEIKLSSLKASCQCQWCTLNTLLLHSRMVHSQVRMRKNENI